MGKNNFIAGLMALCVICSNICAQSPKKPAGSPNIGLPVDSWEVNVRQMPASTRAEITEAMSKLKGTDEDRGIISDVGKAVGMGVVSGLVDAVVSETFNLVQYRKRQKQE